jgi:hypothetical protein
MNLDNGSNTEHDQAFLRRRPPATVVALVALIVGVVIGVVALAIIRDGDDKGGVTADVSGQGGAEPHLASDAARLTRSADGLVAEIDVPTPEPGSYEYPTGEMIPGWAEAHPRVAPGSSDAPEVFTAWVFVFNDPHQCTDSSCDLDDLGADTAARGGSYQLDGLIASGERMWFSGRIRVGQDPLNGARLDSPSGAEVHLAIAAHGRVLSGADRWRQLNGPVGNPTLWWSASFTP